jgi:hypothetical protein
MLKKVILFMRIFLNENCFEHTYEGKGDLDLGGVLKEEIFFNSNENTINLTLIN